MFAAAIAGAVLGLLGSVLVVLRWRRPDTIMTLPMDATAGADAAIPGFGAIDAAIGDDGRAALVLGDGGRVAVIQSRGRRLRAREIAWTMVRNTPEGMAVDTGDRRFGTVFVPGVTALDIRRLGMPPAVEEDVRVEEAARD